jgi:hypothetical protein
MSTREQQRLRAYRELYGAICELSESLFDQASEVTRDEREAALLASCSLVRTLQHQPGEGSRDGLLERIGEVAQPRRPARGAARRRGAVKHAEG